MSKLLGGGEMQANDTLIILQDYSYMHALTYVDEIRQLGKSRRGSNRALVKRDLEPYPTPGDSGRSFISDRRRACYYHSVQDMLFAYEVAVGHLPGRKFLRQCQACFVKDLQWYIEGLPKDETLMRDLFEAVLYAGSSSYWDEDEELVKELYPLYSTIDDTILRSWAKGDVQSPSDWKGREGSHTFV